MKRALEQKKARRPAAARYVIGVDFGTNSVRALVVNVANGAEVGTAVFNYPSGVEGILLDPRNHNLARQSPLDYEAGLRKAIRGALGQARRQVGLSSARVIGLGVHTTGSTPIRCYAHLWPTCLQAAWRRNLNAYAWLWKDHTASAEAAAISAAARRQRPHYLAQCGGAYSAEWFWAKIWHCLNVDPQFFAATHAWIELQDYIPALLCGIRRPEEVVRGICAAGHKAMENPRWGGLPDENFLASLHPRLARLREPISAPAQAIDRPAGYLAPEWAAALGLPAGIPVAVGALDAHLGAVGSGIRSGTLVKIIGTSSCDILVTQEAVPDIPGVCGIVAGSVLPGYYGIEAGQSAVGDIFRWFVSNICGGDDRLQEQLTREAAGLRPGASGLLGLDWHNGNRSPLMDPNLSGLLVGLNLHTSRAEIYRAWLEATAFGALTIIRRIEEYGIAIERVVCCGGIAAKNELFMQIYADILKRPMYLARSAQASALGAAIAGALVAGAYPSGPAAIAAMTGVQRKVFRPRRAQVAAYQELYALYQALQQAFALCGPPPLGGLMKDLLQLKAGARGLRSTT